MSKTTGNIQPLFDNVLIRPVQAETKTQSGIYLPDSAKEKPQMGEVMAIGSGKDCGCGCECDCEKDCDCGKECSCGMSVKVGDKVIYKKWGGNEIKVGNEEWLIVEQKDIMAVIR